MWLFKEIAIYLEQSGYINDDGTHNIDAMAIKLYEQEKLLSELKALLKDVA